MASQKVSVHNVIGNMTVFTMSVDTKELYVTIVMRGDSLWDIHPSVDIESAKATHSYYLTLCQAFDPAVQNAQAQEDAGFPVDKDTLLQDVRNNYSLITVKKGMMH